MCDACTRPCRDCVKVAHTLVAGAAQGAPLCGAITLTLAASRAARTAGTRRETH
jgi:hypothetical protein